MSSEEVRAELMEILRVFASFCEKHRLRYFLAYGSLLGAVRGQEMIPWDDDIDVAMPRPDYERFARLFRADPPIGIALFVPGDDGYPSPFMKLVSTRTRFEAVDYFFPEGFGVYMDIFPLDGTPRLGGRVLFRIAEDVRRIQHRRFPYLKPHLVAEPKTPLNLLKKGAWHLLKAPRTFPSWVGEQLRDAYIALTAASFFRDASRAQLANSADHVISLRSFDKAPRIADMLAWTTFREALIERRHIERSEWVQFGDLRVRSFADPELLLEQWYGPDWEVPNPDYKPPHGQAFWRRGEPGADRPDRSLDSRSPCES